jgi:predicted DNA-binding transcriptional regulator AlpA
MQAGLNVVGPEYLVPLLRRELSTIKVDARRKPESLPPRLDIPGSSKLLWLESDVLDWIKSCSTAKKRR